MSGISAPLPTRPAFGTVVELLKPITWFAPMWAFGCGVVSSGLSAHGRWPLIVMGILLAGPLVCGTSQAINDWYDRFVDAINEPDRPIPSGRIPGQWGLYIALGWTSVSLIVSWFLGPWAFGAAIVGLGLAWAYSAPPLRLKLNGWWGNAAVAACYEGLPWFTGAAIMAGTLPGWRSIVILALYSFGAHGIMTLNDFKSVEGDLKMGIGSLPARLGVPAASIVACVMMAVPQFVVASLLCVWGRQIQASIVAALLVAQLFLMAWMVAKPRERAAAYNGSGTTLYVLGMLASAFALAWLPS